MGTTLEVGRPSSQIREALLDRGETEGAAVDPPEEEGEAWIGRLRSAVAVDVVDSLDQTKSSVNLE